MKSFSFLLAAISSTAITWSIHAEELQPGTHDAEALRLLHQMSQALPLRTTTLEKIAPSFAAEKQPGLTWDQAVAAANTRYGSRQPERAAFLRKYLEDGSPEARLSELQLPEHGVHTTTGSGRSTGFVIGPPEKPEAIISFFIANGRLVGAPSLTLTSLTVDGVAYRHLDFDSEDRLVSTRLQFLADSRLMTHELGQNISGKDGTDFYYAIFYGTKGAIDQSERLHFSPGRVMTERWVSIPNQSDYREFYEQGRLRRRLHYDKRQVKGGTETYVKKEELFP